MPKPKKRKLQATEPAVDVVGATVDESGLSGASEDSDMESLCMSDDYGPCQEKDVRAYEMATEKLLKLQAKVPNESAELNLADRLCKAKLKRFDIAVARNKGSPTLQLERFNQAQLDMKDALLKHARFIGELCRAERDVLKAELALEKSEVVRLKRCLARCVRK